MGSHNTMEDLIPVINKLQDAFARMGISTPLDLPQIAVVGAQSAGKSSVLENCVGKDFLPRGSGIVTRRPLVLQLLNNKGTEYGEFLHKPNKKYADFEQIRQEIEAETDRETGSNKGISNLPIFLRIYSPRVVNLTLVDLPGLTKVAVGDQPPDIERQIRNMILEFIEKPNCLVLAVSPANSDLANSDALKLAKSVDPDGVRTIGVITKLDLMDDGTDAKDIFNNKIIPLRRGYIGVVNRSQRDINGNKDIKAAQEAERQFFLRHPSYRDMASKMGTAYLQKTLNQQLTNHIREVLPSLKTQMTKQLAGMASEVEQIKNYDPNDRGMQTKLLIKSVSAFQENVNQCIEGGSIVSFTELSSGAKISQIFHEQFPYEIARRDFDEAEIRHEIAVGIRNVQGVRVGLFTPDQAFEAVTRKLIENLREPTMECVENVYQELINAISQAGESMSAYPQLRDGCEGIAKRIAEQMMNKALTQANLLLDLELCYINTNHPDFNEKKQKKKVNGKGKEDSGDGNKPPPSLVRKGYVSMPIGTFSSMKTVFFVLMSDKLLWYKDNNEHPKDLKHTIKLDGLKVKHVAAKDQRDQYEFEVYDPVHKYIVKDVKSLVCRCQGQAEVKSWLASFLRAGVIPDKSKGTKEENDTREVGEISMDPQLERQVADIRQLVDSYMCIVCKTLKDIIPKCCMHLLVEGTRKAIKEELLGNLYREYNEDQLMDEDPQEKERRMEVLKLYKSTTEALDIIKDVSSSTYTTSLPPAIDPSSDVHIPREFFDPNLTSTLKSSRSSAPPAGAPPRRPGDQSAPPRRHPSEAAPARRPPPVSRPETLHATMRPAPARPGQAPARPQSIIGGPGAAPKRPSRPPI